MKDALSTWKEWRTPDQRLLISMGCTYLRRFMPIGNSRLSALRNAERIISDCVVVRTHHKDSFADVKRRIFGEIIRLVKQEREYNEQQRRKQGLFPPKP